MGSTTSLVSTIHGGVHGIISFWFSSDHEYSWFVLSLRQCDESEGQSSSEHMWLDMDQIIILALIYHWIFLDIRPWECGYDAGSFARWPSQVKIRCRFILTFTHTISFSHVCHLNWGGGLCLPANLELISQEKCYKEVMDSSINQLVTHHLLTHPRKQRGTWCFHYFGSLHVPYLFAVAHFNLLHWLLFACLGWQHYRA